MQALSPNLIATLPLIWNGGRRSFLYFIKITVLDAHSFVKQNETH